MHLTKLTRIVAVAAASALTLTACGSGTGDSGSSAKEYHVLAVIGTSGPLAALAKGVERSLDVSAKAINKQGGIGGKKITIEIKNDQGDPTQAVNVLQNALTSGSKPDLIYAGITTSETLAMLPLLTRQKLLAISSGGDASLGDASKYPYFFQLPSPTAEQLTGLPAHLQAMGVKKLGIFIQDNAFGAGSETAVKSVLQGSGVDVVTQNFPADDIDLTGSFQKMLAAHPDAVYTDCSGDPCGRILNARYKAGATDLPMIGGLAMSDTALGPQSFASAAANKNLEINASKFAVYVDPADRTPGFNAFYNGYTADNYDISESLYVPALVWDGLHLAQAAADKSGNKIDGESMSKAMIELPSTTEFLTQTAFGYSTTSHSPKADASAFKIIPSSSCVDGLFKPAGS